MDGEWEDVETKTVQYCGAFPPKEVLLTLFHCLKQRHQHRPTARST